MWEQSPGHFDGALSKILVSQSRGSAFLDFRISSYLPGAHVAMHLHESKEQIYYFLEGTGLLTLGDEKTVVHPHQFAFIAPHLPHALSNTGVGQLVFLVITTPSERVEPTTRILRNHFYWRILNHEPDIDCQAL